MNSKPATMFASLAVTARTLAVAGVLATACQGGPKVSSTGRPVDPSRPSGSGNGGIQSTSGGGGGSSGGGIVLPDAGATETSAPPAATVDANCGLQHYALQRRPAEMLLILDRSGSMRETPDPFAPFGSPTKWDETVPAVRETIMKTANMVQWGLKVFPGQSFVACNVPDGVEVPPAIDNYAKIDAAVMMTTPTGTGTPTRYAVQKSVAYFQANASTNARYLVLATDGEPNCADGVTNALVDPDGSVMAVKDAAAAGYKTFVIGIATTMSSAHMTLNLLADAGGSPRTGMGATDARYYPVASRQDLISALSQITGKVADCVFPLDKTPPTPDAVAVDIDGMRVQRDPAKMNGWEYGAANKTIEVYGAACEQIKKGTSDVKIIFGCPGLEIP
jgi:hypothetical protein